MLKKIKTISIIASFKNEEENIKIFVKTIEDEFKKYKNLDYKIYFVNDFSSDNSEKIILNLKKKNKKLILASMSKNYGGSHSIHYGFSIIPSNTFATVIDCDLQDPVKLITKTLNYARNDTLYHFVRKERVEESKFQYFYTILAYEVIRVLSFNKIIPNSNYFKIIPPKIIKKIKNSQEIFPYWNYFISKYSSKSKKIYYSRKMRKFGSSKFNIFTLNPWITFYSALYNFKLSSYLIFFFMIFINLQLLEKSLNYSFLKLIFSSTLIIQIINMFSFSVLNIVKLLRKKIKIKAKIYK